MEEGNKINHKGFKIFIMLFLVASLFLLKEENQKKLIEVFNFIGGKEKGLILTDSFKNEGDILDINIYDNTIVQWSNNKLSFKEPDGINIKEKEFNFTDAFIRYGEKNIYVMDNSTGDIYYLDKKGETINRLQLNKEIFNLKESNQNLIYHIKSSNIEIINVLDKEGVQVGDYSYENKNILTYSTNRNGKKHAVASLEMDKGIIKSHIDYYGENNEKLKELDINGEIVVYLGFTSKDEIVTLTDNSLYLIKDGGIMWEKKFDLIKDIYVDDGKVYILHSNYLETINFDGKTENKVGFAEDYKKILPFEKGTILYGNNQMTIVEGSKQILRHEEDMMGVYASKDHI